MKQTSAHTAVYVIWEFFEILINSSVIYECEKNMYIRRKSRQPQYNQLVYLHRVEYHLSIQFLRV